jgi:hypothetical protein
MANLYVNNGISWVSVKQPYINTAGTFTPAKAVYAHNGISWIQVFYRFVDTISSNITNYNLRNAAIASGWDGNSKLNAIVTVSSGASITGTGNNTSAAFVISNIPTLSLVTIQNNGTIVGAGGAKGSVAAGGLTAQSYPGNYNGTFVTPTYANGYNGTGYPTGAGAGGSTPGYNVYPGSPYSGGTGGPGAAGSTALYLVNSNITLTINNAGRFVGGGGGAGGQAFNNSGGGGGGAGGYLIEESGTHPAIIAVNSTGGILASGGGGSGGWGNRYINDGIGGRPGFAATNLPGGEGNYGGNGISPGLATNNTGITLINTAGTFTLSPARV